MRRIATRWIAILALHQLACAATRSSTLERPASGEHRTQASSLVTPVASTVSVEPAADWDCSRQVELNQQDLGSAVEVPGELALRTLNADLNDSGRSPDGQRCSQAGQRSIVEPDDCREHPGTLAALAQALEIADVRQRDRRLARLEPCHSLTPGLVSALRAELDPTCSDVIAQAALNQSGRAEMSLQIRATLVALAHAARVMRSAAMPRFAGNGKRENVERYRVNTVRPWLAAQTKRIQATGERLGMLDGTGYARAISAMALATAWSQVYIGARSRPVPDSIKRQYDERSRYYGMLDEELSPIRARALQAHAEAAALVSRHGIRHSPLADQWFKTVGAVANRAAYNAAEYLSVTRPTDCAATTPVERLARRIPAFYAGVLFTGSELTEPCVVRGLIDQGISLAHRRAWQQNRPSAEIASLLAYGHVALARRSFDALHFDEALRRLVYVRASRQHLTVDEELLLATACAARSVPWNVAPDEGDRANIRTGFEPLVRYAQTIAPEANRSLALLNAALMAPMAGWALAVQAQGLFNQSMELANGTSAQPCVTKRGWLFGASPWLERRTVDACVIVEPL